MLAIVNVYCCGLHTVLETAMPNITGMTPVDMIPVLLSDISTNYPYSIATESENGQNLIHISFEQELDNNKLQRDCWIDSEARLVRAEHYLNGNRLLTCTFSDFSFK